MNSHGHMTLKEAKTSVDNLLDGKPLEVKLSSRVEAKEFLEVVRELGCVGEILEE